MQLRLELFVDDVARSLAFYVDVLDFRLVDPDGYYLRLTDRVDRRL